MEDNGDRVKKYVYDTTNRLESYKPTKIRRITTRDLMRLFGNLDEDDEGYADEL
jgi:hypothetical protein